MKKLFGLLLLALAFLAPDLAHAANRFAVCSTTCTWDNTSTAMWSASSGGATGASAPTSADDVILDANTCVGGTTCTITTFAGTISAATITWGACTASTIGCIIAANTNNTNFTLGPTGGSNFSGTGTGTRKWVGGTGTYNLTNGGGFGHFFDMSTTTNDQGSTFNSATWIANSTGGLPVWQNNGFSFGATTFTGNTSSRGAAQIAGNTTWASLTFSGPLYVQFTTGNTQTVTGALTVTGASASNAIAFESNSVISSSTTISLGSASTADWIALRAITFSGAATITATDCLNLGGLTLNGGSCTPPSAGGGGGGHIIGG